jgi:hypothetical protein
MKSEFKFAVLALAFLSVLLLASSAKATCAQDLTNYFSQYVTQSTNSTGTRINQSVNLSGYSTFNGDPNCQMPFPEVHHMPQIFNQIGITGGWTYSSQIYCATCYMSLASSLTITTTAGTDFVDEFGGEIDCNVAGIFFAFPIPTLYIEVAYTRALSLGAQSNCYWNNKIGQEICTISATPWCTPSTRPPDWPVNAVSSQVYPPPPPSWWEAFDVCVSYGSPGHLQPWACLPTGAAAEMYTLNPPVAFCTHNP